MHACRAYVVGVHIIAPNGRTRSNIEDMHIRKGCRNISPVQYESDSLEEIDDATLQMVFRTNIFSYFFMTK